jgi:hypothetical protein
MFVVAVAKIHIIIELLHDCHNVLMQFNNKAIIDYCNIAIRKYYKWASLSLNPALGFAECRLHLGITIEQARGFCSRLALPWLCRVQSRSGRLMQAWLSSRLTLHLLWDCGYCILGKKTN